MNLTAGTALQNGKYVLNTLCGQSELGITFTATQARSLQTVVVKTLRSQPQADIAHLKQHFLDEARRFSQCQHPGLVRVLDIFEDAGLPFVIMDYVAGETLAERVRSRGALPEAQAVQYIRQAGSALSVMHRNGLVHGDVQPEHLVRPKGADFVVLVFGTRYQLRGQTVKAAPGSYTAIEQGQRQGPLTPATDIYALAATLYFLVTGQPPIAASLRNQSLLPLPRQIQPQLGAAIEHAILSGMALSAHERPQTIAAWFTLLPDRNPLPAVQVRTAGGPSHDAIEQRSSATTANGSRPPVAPPPVPPVSTSPLPATRYPSRYPSAYKSRLPKALVMTSAIAITVGIGLGLALRFSAERGIGPTFFQTKQDFPPLQGWPSEVNPADLPTAPPLPIPPPVVIRSRQVAPDPLPKVKFSPTPLPSPSEPTPTPTTAIEATPTPLPSADAPDSRPPSLPNPAATTAPDQRPLPSVQTPVTPPVAPPRQEPLPLKQ